jgi:hypothetical protein
MRWRAGRGTVEARRGEAGGGGGGEGVVEAARGGGGLGRRWGLERFWCLGSECVVVARLCAATGFESVPPLNVRTGPC